MAWPREDGHDYIINGQKTWSTMAHTADYAWLSARTDPGGHRHKSISLFVVDNKTPGVTIRPLINIAGEHSFNEVFFDKVRVPKENIIVSSGYAMLALEKLQEQATVAKCAELLGIIQTAFQMSVSYAKERTQFGRPIGSFQYLYYRKAKAGEIAFGNSSHHLEKVADWLGL